MITIHELDDISVELMTKELTILDKNLHKKLDYLVKKTACTKAEGLEYLVSNAPALWAKVYLSWEARDYQQEILNQGKRSKKLVLRLGRRLGKSECMCILILWHAFTQVNKGPNNQYDILVVTPYETQIDLIFKRLNQLIDLSPLLKSEIERTVHHKIKLKNGTEIKGLTAGTKSGNGAASTRGQRADLLVIDECDYLNSEDITNILNIRNEAPDRIKVIAASTPSGKHAEYYKWCTGSSLSFFPSKEDIENYSFSKFLSKERPKGNGWVEVYAPSMVNKEILKINPDTGQSYLKDIENELSSLRFEQEVMAEFGSEEMGVYLRKFLDGAVAEGERINHKYTTEFTDEELNKYLKESNNIKILGVDWDEGVVA